MHLLRMSHHACGTTSLASTEGLAYQSVDVNDQSFGLSTVDILMRLPGQPVHGVLHLSTSIRVCLFHSVSCHKTTQIHSSHQAGNQKEHKSGGLIDLPTVGTRPQEIHSTTHVRIHG